MVPRPSADGEASSSTMSSAPVDTACGDAAFDARVKAEFPQLGGVAYLDHGGAPVPPRSLIEAHLSDLTSSLLGNPHSQSASSRLSTHKIEHARRAVLSLFGAVPREYAVVFTSGCTGALKLVADCYDWERLRDNGERSVFAHATDVHNSVLGIREVAAAAGALCVPVDAGHLDSLANASDAGEPTATGGHVGLFAMTAQCNFSGFRHNLDVVRRLRSGSARVAGREGRWHVLVDVAAMAGTAALDVSACGADFVAVSFYKMFGYPTGLGALLVRHDAASTLRKRYFGGGTVAAATATERYHVLREELSARFEDGTVSFQAIAAVPFAIDVVDRLFGGIGAVGERVCALAEALRTRLKALTHWNGRPVVVVYERPSTLAGGDGRRRTHGGVVAFNVLRADGSFVGYSEVEKLAALSDIHLRTGCFCNPGACQEFLGLSAEDVRRNLEAGHVCWDDNDTVNGRPTGAVRASLGMSSSAADAQRLVDFLDNFFSERNAPANGNVPCAHTSSDTPRCRDSDTPRVVGVVEKLLVYPVKSCGAFEVDEWAIGDKGFLHDREFMVMDAAGGGCLTQKHEPRMCLVRPRIDLSARVLELTAPGVAPLRVSLDLDNATAVEAGLCSARVCGDKIRGVDCGPEAAAWLSAFLERDCLLVRQLANDARTCKIPAADPGDTVTGDDGARKRPSLSLSNESHFLMVSRESVRALNAMIAESIAKMDSASGPDDDGGDIPAEQFRPNIVIGSVAGTLSSSSPSPLVPFEEDAWDEVDIAGGTRLRAVGPCNRCRMVCIDQTTGLSRKEPLRTLAIHRRSQGRIYFGVHLMIRGSDSAGMRLKAGSAVMRRDRTLNPVSLPE